MRDYFSILTDRLRQRNVMIESEYGQYALHYFLRGADAADPAEAKRYAIRMSGIAENPTRSRISKVHNDPRVQEALAIISEEMTEILKDREIGMPALFAGAMRCMAIAQEILEKQLEAARKDPLNAGDTLLKRTGDYFDKITRLSGNAAPDKHEHKVDLDMEVQRLDDNELTDAIKATIDEIKDLQRRIAPPD